MTDRPNIVYFHVDNLGYGELGCYGGDILRGVDTKRIDQFAREGFQLLNFAPEAQCTPSRTAPLTGRHAIRTGNHTVAAAGAESGDEGVCDERPEGAAHPGGRAARLRAKSGREVNRRVGQTMIENIWAMTPMTKM
jgi:arylsulfatase A-like enzyme